jgi:membrane fusion protein (multidrug efflux system)
MEERQRGVNIKMKKIKILLVLLVLCAAGGVYYMLNIAGKETTDDARFDSYIVPISAKVSGYVKELNVKDNQVVKAGDPLLEINPVDYQIAVDKAQAALEAAEAQYQQATENLAATKVSAPSSVDAAKAAVAAAQADLDNATKDAERNRKLKGITASTREIDLTNTAAQTAKARLQQAEAELKSAETSTQTIAGADAGTRMLFAQVAGKKAELATAQENLDNTKITVPMDGKVTSRTVETGAYVQPGQALMAISSPNLWVVADFKETQLEHIQVGQPVEVKVDAFPHLVLHGKIDSVQAGTGARLSLFPPENATGNFVKVVQRVPVKVTLDEQPDAALALAPGMSVEATVLVK